MFLIDCSRHGSRVLVPATRIRGFVNANVGILVDLECWCGEHVQLLTGRRSPLLSQAVRHSPAPALTLAGSAHGSNL